MSDIAVGSVQHYVAGSTWFDLNRYEALGVKERVSINLASSNLWLIDSRQLRLEEDYAPRIAFLNEGAGYQSPIQISATGPTTGVATVFSNLSGYNSIMPNASGPLYRGDWVQLSEIQAGTQINLSVIPNGVFNSNAVPLSTDPSKNPVSSYNPNSPVFWVAYADPKATKPIIVLGYEDIAGKGSDNDFNDGILAIDLGQATFQKLFSSANLGQDSKINLAKAKPASVPFTITPTLGLLIVAAVISMTRIWQLQFSKQVSAKKF